MDAGSPYPWLKEMNWEDRGLLLVHLLKSCAKYIESASIMNADTGLDYISHLASPDGDSMQRVATYVSEGLAYQVVKNLRGVPKAMSLSRTLSTSEQLLVKKLFYDLYPFLKIAYVITNQAIAEAMEGENLIHVIDLSASEANQWIYLMQSLRERSEKPPYLKITGIHEKKEVLDQMGFHLKLEAEKLNLPFQFNAIVSNLENLDLERLPVKKGEPLAISCLLQLHSLLATDVQLVNMIRCSPSASMNQRTFAEMLGKNNKIDPSPDSALSPLSSSLYASPKMECFLNGLWKLQPRVMVITEQESNVNGSNLTDRVDQALHFYGAMFDCLESTIPKTAERILMERMLLGEEIKNIVACEGVERKERHEKLEAWIPRLELAGFGRVPISFDGMLQATRIMSTYGHGYKLLQDNKCLLICWNDKPLFSVSAWRF